ncbi:hypothetical protein ACWOAH_06660 [Vagococcus vulneris]|uniref:Uncharacterized protein n=1 Tax=Vagococcus vulneris TaxID=1977869 RepID=A0A429ZY76_9ENTE|nr:hypothetical protein [Vagococcus vulneris]RST98889.1 hypothetical protein CBF37_05820 [Vagococcus vulneris]
MPQITPFESITFLIFLIFWLLLVHKSNKVQKKTVLNDQYTLKKLIKQAFPSIFTPTKNIILLLFFFCALFIFDIKDVKIATYFPVSLTALSLLLTTSNISNSLFVNDDDPNNSQNVREAYFGRILFTAIIWLSINIYSFCVPLLHPNLLSPHSQKIITIIFLEIFCLGILLIFDLLVLTIKIYRKNDAYTERINIQDKKSDPSLIHRKRKWHAKIY